MSSSFKLRAPYKPAGDQPLAIEKLTTGLQHNKRNQILLGVTGSGKTFTMAHVIQQTQRPAIIMAHNKTLAAQLFHEMKQFFPENAVEYFVSYYDYYQPEAYVAKTDTFIEKDSSINEQIDRLRHSATRALLERRDVIVIASVSCIYGIGSAENYSDMVLYLQTGKEYLQRSLLRQLAELQYERHDMDFRRGSFRLRGDVLDIFPAHKEDQAWRLSFFGDELETIQAFDPLTGEFQEQLSEIFIYPNSHYVIAKPTISRAITRIKAELKLRLAQLEEQGKLVEAQRLAQRTQYDIEMIQETGSCKGIENYSRHINGLQAGEAPPTLFSYLPEDAILFVDESHVTVPQIAGMYEGDRSRKATLVEYGFRLPSCLDNRPLKFAEWDIMRPQTIFVSATPGKWELQQVNNSVVEQIIRPTGLVDPPVEVKPVATQVDDLMAQLQSVIKNNMRAMVTTLTKHMAEELADYLTENSYRVTYLHSDIDTIERVEIIRQLRLGEIDILIGVNLLREGLDIPECGLVAILDADKEGFLRSGTALIQTIGRAARNAEARVILYADKITSAIEFALTETNRRRSIQLEYNRKHGIVPKTVQSTISDPLGDIAAKASVKRKHKSRSGGITKSGNDNNMFAIANEDIAKMSPQELQRYITKLRDEMLQAAANLEFEQAALLRDKIRELEHNQ